MIDYSAGEISNEEGKALVEYLAERMNTEQLELHAGISYRHCLVIHNAELGTDLTPPHDITGKPIRNCIPAGTASFYPILWCAPASFCAITQ